MNHEELTRRIAALSLPASVVVKSQTKKLPARAVTFNGERILVRAVIRWDDQCGNGHNHFSVTGEYTRPGESWEQGGGGCIHEQIRAAFPEFAHLIRWHLFDPSGPMHYVANTVYFAGERDHWGLLKGEKRQHTSRGKYQAGGVEGIPQWELELTGMPDEKEIYAATAPAPFTISARWVPCGITGEGKARELDNARSSAAWPDATDEDLTAPGLEERLIARLPALVEQMKKDIEALGFTY